VKILIGITSSIAAYKIPDLISQLKKQNHEVITMITEASKSFVAPQSLAVMSQNPCYQDEHEWGNTQEVLHIKLARWCDVCLIAPLTANTIAKIAHGLCDNLVTSAVRALGNKKLILAPAMNTRMWENPITGNHLEMIAKYYNVTLINPVEKVLADGDRGMGALAEIETITEVLNNI
jgi:phosphopantothenoylcysteine decarboxylase